MNLKNSFCISAFLYIFFLLFLYATKSKQEDTSKIEIQKGNSIFISFVFTNRAEGISQNAQAEKSLSSEGSIAEEVNKIRNKIAYPQQALEDGLESECEWSIVINEKQKASQIKTIQSCKYKIFEEEFRRVIQDWNFSLPENTILQIPVSFKIK